MPLRMNFGALSGRATSRRPRSNSVADESGPALESAPIFLQEHADDSEVSYSNIAEKSGASRERAEGSGAAAGAGAGPALAVSVVQKAVSVGAERASARQL